MTMKATILDTHGRLSYLTFPPRRLFLQAEVIVRGFVVEKSGYSVITKS